MEKNSWLDVRGNNILTAKSIDTNEPKNYRPITWPSTTYKLLPSGLRDRTYSHLVQNDLFQQEEKGSRHGSYGCKDQLKINKMIPENWKKKETKFELSMNSLQTFYSVRHEWILRSLELFKVSVRVIGFLRHNMKDVSNSYTWEWHFNAW